MSDTPAPKPDAPAAALLADLMALVPPQPPAETGQSSWVERRRDRFDTADAYGDA